MEETELQLLSGIRQEPASGMSHARLSLRLTALDWTLRATPVAVSGRMTVEQIVNLLKRVPAGLRRWTWEENPRTRGGKARTWQIDNEYHVQNLLYFLLAPTLPDLTDEQYLAPVGQKNPRADLIVPSMKLAIEVKFQRAGDAPQKIIDEIASDASLYLVKDSPYRGIVCFIWDDASRIGDHDYLAAGLKKIHGILDLVIVPRPGNMNRTDL